MAKFRVIIDSMWSKDGFFEELAQQDIQRKEANSVCLRATKLDENDDTRTFVAIPEEDMM